MTKSFKSIIPTVRDADYTSQSLFRFVRTCRRPVCMLGLRSKGIIYDQFQHMRSLFNTSSHEHQSMAASLVVVEGGYLAKAHKPKLSLILLQAWAEEVRILVVLCSKYDNASTVYGKVDNKIRLSYCISSNIILDGLMF